MANVIDYLGQRAGVFDSGPSPDGVHALDPGWGGGLGDIAPGLIVDSGGNGSRMLSPFPISGEGVTAGHGAIVMVAIVIVALAGFHVWTRAKQA